MYFYNCETLFQLAKKAQGIFKLENGLGIFVNCAYIWHYVHSILKL